MLIYNLLPFLVTNYFFIELCILISRKDAPTPEGLDMYIKPLIEELQLLWKGVIAQDFSKPVGDRQFKLCGLILWTISNYPAYGLVLGVCTHGYRGCAICGPKTDSRSTASRNKMNADNKVRGSKIIFGGGRRWTCRNHPYRHNLEFNGKVEDRGPPVRMSAEQTIRCARERAAYISQGGRDGGKHNPAKVHGVKRFSAIYELEYWKVCTLAPSADVTILVQNSVIL
jgi:hypothetical protein